MLEHIQATDLRVLKWIHRNMRNRVCNVVMPVVTVAGNFGFIWFVIIGYLFFSKQNRTAAFEAFWALFSCALLGNHILKNIVKRPRPFTVAEGINTIIHHPIDYSFPSGHTNSSFAAATVLCFFGPWLGIPALILAVTIAYSRLYLCVHFLSDVLFSIFMGVGIGLIIHWLLSMHLF